MKKTLILTIFFILSSCTYATAQTVEITQETANLARDCFVERKALQNELEVKTQAITDLQSEISRLREELALKTGELIGVKQENTSQRELIKTLVPQLRAKKIGLINF